MPLYFNPPAARFLRLSAAFVILLSVGPLHSQEAPKYTAEEYKAYQEATAATEPAKKTELVVQFLQTYKESSLRNHVIAAYQGMMNDLQAGEKWAELIASGEAYIAAVPEDTYTESMLATGYQTTKDLKKFVAYGEKVYEKNPQGNTAYYLAKAYLDLKNDAKFLAWGEKTVEHLPDNLEILLEMTKKYAEANKNAQSAKYGRMTIKAFQEAKKPEGVQDKDWNAYTRNAFATSYAVVGNVAYEQQDYNTAATYLESSLKYYGRNDRAYYFLAQAYWHQGKIDLAMKNFAKAFLLGGATSRAAKQYLDNLYKSTHQNSLVGIERVIDKAKQELP